jgi:hypothetical protein
MGDTLPRGQLALAALLLNLLSPAAGLELILQLLKASHQRAHAVGRSLSHHSIVISARLCHRTVPEE